MLTALISGCGKKEVSSFYDPSVPVKDAGGLKLPLTSSDEEISWSVTTTSDTIDPNETYVSQNSKP